MNLSNQRGFPALFLLAIVSLTISSCIGAAGVTANSIPPTDRLHPSITNVANLYLLAPESMPVGVAVPAGRSKNSILKSTVRQTTVNRHFSQITAENIMKPSYLHPGEGTFFFPTDILAGKDDLGAVKNCPHTV